jgi:hypothetical protein
MDGMKTELQPTNHGEIKGGNGQGDFLKGYKRLRTGLVTRLIST